MKNLCIFISIILILLILAFSYALRSNTITLSLNSVPELSVAVYFTMIGVIGFLAGFILNQSRIVELKTLSTKQVRKAEKADIDSKENVDKIARLNAKIETLEIALQKAIKNNN